VLAHHPPGPKEFLAADFVEGGAGVLQHVEPVEDDLCLLHTRLGVREVDALGPSPAAMNSPIF
jgi:hypothetical protein